MTKPGVLKHYANIFLASNQQAPTGNPSEKEGKVPPGALTATIIIRRITGGVSRYQFLFPVILLAAAGIASYVLYRSDQNVFNSQQWVRHTEQVIYKTGYLVSLANEAESSSHAFVITGDQLFLNRLFFAKKYSHGYITELKQLTADNASQQQRLDSFQNIMLNQLGFLYRLVYIRSKQGLQAAITLLATHEGQAYTDHLRKIASAIQQEEDTLLKTRNEQNRKSAAAFKRNLWIMFILITIFLVVANTLFIFQRNEKEKKAAQLSAASNELKKAEGDINRLNEELEQKVLKRTAELESANKELESFSYSVSHDLRAPLRAVHGYTRMLKEDYGSTLDAEANRVINKILDNGKKMGRLIDDLLSFSRLGRKELVKTSLPMTDMVTSLVNEIKEQSDNGNTEFRINTLQPAYGDSAAIKQVWVNLISNAIKYSRPTQRPVIEIASESHGEEINYSIKDNGVGFDMRYANKLFGVFQRLHSEEEFEGTGVGLATVHRIISKHGGRVWANSKVNEGATFNFSLPKMLPGKLLWQENS